MGQMNCATQPCEYELICPIRHRGVRMDILDRDCPLYYNLSIREPPIRDIYLNGVRFGMELQTRGFSKRGNTR